MIIALPFIVMLVGLVTYVVASKPPGSGVAAEIGRIMFAFGLLAILLQSPEVLKIIGR